MFLFSCILLRCFRHTEVLAEVSIVNRFFEILRFAQNDGVFDYDAVIE